MERPEGGKTIIDILKSDSTVEIVKNLLHQLGRKNERNSPFQSNLWIDMYNSL